MTPKEQYDARKAERAKRRADAEFRETESDIREAEARGYRRGVVDAARATVKLRGDTDDNSEDIDVGYDVGLCAAEVTILALLEQTSDSNRRPSDMGSDMDSAMSEWQPIETAPNDRLIDIWFNGKRWAECYYDSYCDEWRTSRPGGLLVSVKARHVTHWMPLPPPPMEQSNA
jgi:hypothetical protein